MLTHSSETLQESSTFVNPIQEIPIRHSIYSINKCEDQVIGFEFVAHKLSPEKTYLCNNIAVSLCVPLENVKPFDLDTAEFWATDDPCYNSWLVKKITTPEVDIQRDVDNKVIGILVRFSKNESCCYPLNMAFRLYGIIDDCKFSLSQGLLIFK